MLPAGCAVAPVVVGPKRLAVVCVVATVHGAPKFHCGGCVVGPIHGAPVGPGPAIMRTCHERTAAVLETQGLMVVQGMRKKVLSLLLGRHATRARDVTILLNSVRPH